MIKMNNEAYYLCEYFRLIYLFKILFKPIILENKKVVIYYLKPNNTAIFIEKNNKLFSKIFLSRIAIKHLPQDTPIMQNNLNRLLDKAYIDVLYDIMHRVDKDILQSKASLLNLLNNKMSLIKDSVRLYIKDEIALDVMYGLFLVEMAKWIISSSESLLYRADFTLFIDKKNYWSNFVFEHANKNNIPFISVDNFITKRNKTLQFCFYVIKFFAEYSTSLFINKKTQPKGGLNKIGIPYYVFKNFTEFFYKRNYYLFWYPQSGVGPERVVIYADGNLDIDIEEKNKIEDLGFTILSCNSFLKKVVKFIPKYKCSPQAIKLFFAYIKQSLNLLFHVNTRVAMEQWKILMLLFIKLPYWEDFFSSNNIKIKFRFHDSFSHRDIAAILAGAVAISYKYSNHSLESFCLLHQDICDVYFSWGKKYEECFLNEHSDIKNIIYTGYIFDYTFDILNKNSEQLRRSFTEKGKNFVIALMDENIIGPNRGPILYLYSLLLEFLINEPDIGLIIKPKTKYTSQVLQTSEKTSKFFRLLEKEQRIRVLDSAKFAVEAGKASDLAIGICSSSTAALECVFAGIPAIIYECIIGEQERYPLHKYGKGKIIFFDSQSMLDSIKRYKSDRTKSNGFADWSGFLNGTDPFRDGKANRRIGFYLKTLLDKFDSGLTKAPAIDGANRIYAAEFGSDKVASLK